MRRYFKVRVAAALCLCSLLILASPAAGMAQTSPTAAAGQQITLQQAITMALTASPSLKASTDNAENAQNNQSLAAEPLIGAAEAFTPSGSTSPQDQAYFNNLVAANLNAQLTQQQQQAAQESVVYQVYADYYGILQDQSGVNAGQQALSADNLTRQETVLENQLGSASQYQVLQEKQIYANDQTTLAGDQANLTTIFQQFDQLLGLATDATPVLTDQPSYSPLVIGSLDAEVSRVLNSDPAVTSAENTVSKDMDDMQVYSYNATSNNVTATILAADEQNLITEENSVAQAERNLYLTILQKEANQSSLQQALATDQANLAMVQLESNIGQADSLDVASVQSKVAADQNALLDNIVQHQLEVQQFQTPWASGGGSGAGSSS